MTTESTLRKTLASQFDEYTIREQVRIGERNTVYRVTVDGCQAACKMTESQPATLAREGAIVMAVSEFTPVRVPTVLEMGAGYLLLEWVDGETYDSDDGQDRCRARLRDVGRTLARLHSATERWFTGHGTIRRENGSFVADRPINWADRFMDFVDEWASELTGTRDGDVGAAVVQTVDAHRHLFVDCLPVLVHGEASPDHVLFDDQEVLTLLDWELSQAAPGAFDLVWAERDLLGRPVGNDDYSEFRRALIEGYEAERRLESGFSFRREIYRAAFAMRELTIVNDPTMPAQSDEDEYGASLRTYVYDRLEAAESTNPMG